MSNFVEPTTLMWWWRMSFLLSNCRQARWRTGREVVAVADWDTKKFIDGVGNASETKEHPAEVFTYVMFSNCNLGTSAGTGIGYGRHIATLTWKRWHQAAWSHLFRSHSINQEVDRSGQVNGCERQKRSFNTQLSCITPSTLWLKTTDLMRTWLRRSINHGTFRKMQEFLEAKWCVYDTE